MKKKTQKTEDTNAKTVNRKKLIEALEILKPGLDKRGLVEQSDSFAIQEGQIISFNDEIGVFYPFPELEGINVVISADEFYNILKKYGTEEVSVSTDESQVIIGSKKSKAGLYIKGGFNMPIDEIGKFGEFEVIDESIVDSMYFVSKSASKDSSRPKMMTVHLFKGGTVEATDNFRATQKWSSEAGIDEEFLLPTRAVGELKKLRPNEVSIAGNGWVHWRRDGIVVSTRVFDSDDYPDTGSVISGWDGIEVKFPDGLLDAVQRAHVFINNQDFLNNYVVVSINSNKVTVSSDGETGWFEEEVEGESLTKEEVSFKVNPDIFADVLGHMDKCIVGQNLIKFEAEDWVHVVALFVDNK